MNVRKCYLLRYNQHVELKRILKNNFLQKLVFHAKKLWLEVIFASSEKEYSVKINYKNLSHWYLVNIPMCFYETVYLPLFIPSNIKREITSNFHSSTKREIAFMVKTNVEMITTFGFCRKTDTQVTTYRAEIFSNLDSTVFCPFDVETTAKSFLWSY